MQLVLVSGIEIGSKASNSSTGAMQDISNVALISVERIVNSVQCTVSITLINHNFIYAWQTWYNYMKRTNS